MPDEFDGNNRALAMKLLSLLCAACAATLTSAASDQRQWPRVWPIDVTIGIETGAKRIYVSLPIRGEDGKQEYLFWCRGGADEDAIGRESKDIAYVPPLLCILTAGSQEQEVSLLHDQGTSGGPWHTRGYFRWEELVGSCGDYPEYGRKRRFRLRGFEFQLEAKNLVYEAGNLSHFDLGIRLKRDPSATSSISERTGYLRPDPGCAVVKKWGGTGK